MAYAVAAAAAVISPGQKSDAAARTAREHNIAARE
jgi:hypothetical protein